MVVMILGSGFEPVEAIAPCDILRRGGVEVQLAGIGGRMVEAGHGVTVQADCTIEEADFDRAEMVVLPGRARRRAVDSRLQSGDGRGGTRHMTTESSSLPSVQDRPFWRSFTSPTARRQPATPAVRRRWEARSAWARMWRATGKLSPAEPRVRRLISVWSF